MKHNNTENYNKLQIQYKIKIINLKFMQFNTLLFKLFILWKVKYKEHINNKCIFNKIIYKIII